MRRLGVGEGGGAGKREPVVVGTAPNLLDLPMLSIRLPVSVSVPFPFPLPFPFPVSVPFPFPFPFSFPLPLSFPFPFPFPLAVMMPLGRPGFRAGGLPARTVESICYPVDWLGGLWRAPVQCREGGHLHSHEPLRGVPKSALPFVVPPGAESRL